jgi:hypothetical protein
MLEYRRGQELHIVGHYVRAADARGECSRRALQTERAARTHTEQQIAVVPARLDDVDDVSLQLGRDMNLAECLRPRCDDVRVGDRLEIFRRDRARILCVEDRELGVAIGIADAETKEEPVELGFGQRIRAFELDRVLRRDDEKR